MACLRAALVELIQIRSTVRYQTEVAKKVAYTDLNQPDSSSDLIHKISLHKAYVSMKSVKAKVSMRSALYSI